MYVCVKLPSGVEYNLEQVTMNFIFLQCLDTKVLGFFQLAKATLH
uniref:Uncharacterized protein n=1 Tax=Arundo donax TaxID=35708 RepID=A0A0A8Y3S1_ARUDO